MGRGQRCLTSSAMPATPVQQSAMIMLQRASCPAKSCILHEVESAARVSRDSGASAEQLPTRRPRRLIGRCYLGMRLWPAIGGSRPNERRPGVVACLGGKSGAATTVGLYGRRAPNGRGHWRGDRGKPASRATRQLLPDRLVTGVTPVRLRKAA
jgi:hypothetical protein